METTAKWIPLNPAHLNEERAERIAGLDAHVYLSPYDVPQAVRAFQLDGGDVGVEFKYIDSSEPKFVLKSGTVLISIGRNSRRVFEVKMPSSSLTHPIAQNFISQVKEALARVAISPDVELPRAENYELASRVVEEEQSELASTAYLGR